jgi:hypothetical protein
MCGKGTLKNIHFINKSKGNENINMGNKELCIFQVIKN